MKIPEKKIKAYALKNAIAHDGKVNQGAVISALFNEGMKKEEVKEYAKISGTTCIKVNSMTLEEQKKEYENLKDEVSEREIREGLSELPNVPKTGVVMRFRPAPSGPLHIGHIISNMINSLYVKKYGGKFYIIIDDTNPEEALFEAYKNIKKDCDWIFGNVCEYINASDRMKIYYKYAEELIKKNLAYICTCSQEEFKKFAEQKKECSCRKNSIKNNLEKWRKMLSKNGFAEGEAVLRFKSNMQDPNPAMRDFPLARINLHEHPLQKNKYRVWPLMNLSVTVDDIELKITHIIRGKDHADNAKRQEMIYKVLGLEKKFPWTFFMGKIKFTDIALSKRKLNTAIKEGEYSGAEDVRLPTISSLRKRKYKPGAFVKFAEQRGLTDVDKVISQEDFFKAVDNLNKN